MPRSARVIIPGYAHHITQRGNNRFDVFFVDQDREVFIDYLHEASERFGLVIDGFCLMTNHYHLIATPKQEQSLSQALKRTHQLYAQYVNRMHGRTGHLWQDRFFSCTLDNDHFWNALLYVERNPVRARMCRKAWRWPWSSAGAHCGETGGFSFLDMTTWKHRMDHELWRSKLCIPEDELYTYKLRLWTSRGRPLGTDRFVAKLETTLGKRLRPLPRGRPPQKSRHK